MSRAISGVGTLFQRWDGVIWETIAGIKTITGPGLTRDVFDVTALDTVGGYRNFKRGFAASGVVTLVMIFRRYFYELINNDFESNELQNYRIYLPDDDLTILAFEGMVSGLPMSIPSDDVVTVEVSLQVSGPVSVETGDTGGDLTYLEDDVYLEDGLYLIG